MPYIFDNSHDCLNLMHTALNQQHMLWDTCSFDRNIVFVTLLKPQTDRQTEKTLMWTQGWNVNWEKVIVLVASKCPWSTVVCIYDNDLCLTAWTKTFHRKTFYFKQTLFPGFVALFTVLLQFHSSAGSWQVLHTGGRLPWQLERGY